VFDLKNRTVFVTGGAGLLGRMHCEAILEYGGTAIVADYNFESAVKVSKSLNEKFKTDRAHSVFVDVTDKGSIIKALSQFPDTNVLINNAAHNPNITPDKKLGGHFETMTLEQWKKEISTTLDGTFLCSQVFCKKFSEDGFGIVINIASDLGIIAPDQRIYKEDRKPITYSASKFGVVGMTKYLATYFADKNIRVNCLSPGGIYVNQPSDFVDRLSNLIPMGRMAQKDEYKGAIVFMCSDASSYMTGANISIDGGRTAW